MTKNKFAIVDEAGSSVAGSIAPTESYEGPYTHPLIMGTPSEQKLYPTRAAAQLELDRTCSLGSFRIVEV